MAQRGRPKGSLAADARRHKVTVRLDDDEMSLVEVIAARLGYTVTDVLRLGINAAVAMSEGEGYALHSVPLDEMGGSGPIGRSGFWLTAPKPKRDGRSRALSVEYHLKE